MGCVTKIPTMEDAIPPGNKGADQFRCQISHYFTFRTLGFFKFEAQPYQLDLLSVGGLKW